MAKVILNNGDSGLSARTAINDNFTELYNENANPTHTHTAAETTFTPTAGLVSTNTQAAVEEVNGKIGAQVEAYEVAVVPIGNITTTDVQASLEELDTNISASGNLKSDGTILMDAQYLPTSGKEIATVGYVQDYTSSNTTTYIKDTLAEMLLIDPTVVGDVCFVINDGANDGEYLSNTTTTGGSVIGDWSLRTSTVAWGAISGTLSDQTDLQTELDEKLVPDGSVPITMSEYTPMVDTSTLTEGQVAYDYVAKTLVVKSDIAGQTLNVGQETLIRVYNPDVSNTYTNGQVVKLIGIFNGTPTIGLAQADTFSNANTLGILTQDIAPESFGYTTTFGLVGDIPVDQGGETWNAGDRLFLSDTVAGGLTKVLPPVGTTVGVLLTTTGVTGTIFSSPESLFTLPPVGGWMKAIPTTIAPGAGYNQFSGFTDVSTSAGISGDGVTGIFSIDNSGTYEISLSVSFSGITAQNNGSIITVQLYNVNGAVSLFEYNIIVGRNDTVASGTLITQGDFTDAGQLVARYKETSGGVGGAVSVDNISFIVKSVLIR